MFAAHHAIAAVHRTPTTYYCDVRVPFNWEDQSTSDGLLGINGYYQAFIYDSGLPSALIASADASSGRWVVASNLPGSSGLSTPSGRTSAFTDRSHRGADARSVNRNSATSWRRHSMLPACCGVAGNRPAVRPRKLMAARGHF